MVSITIFTIILLTIGVIVATRIDLAQILTGLKLDSINISMKFENLRVNDGVVSFDKVEFSGGESEDADVKVFDIPELSSSLNLSVDPCSDFYSFVCDNWIAKNDIRDADTSIGHMSILTNLVGHQLDDLLSNARDSKKPHHHLVSQFYQRCREHKNSTDNAAFATLLNKLRLVEHSIDGLNDWLLYFRPITFLYDVTVTSSEMNSSVNILQISPTGAILGHQAYSKKEYHFEYASMREFLTSLLGLLQEDDIENEVFPAEKQKFVDRIENFFKVDRIISKIDWDLYFSSFVPEENMRLMRNSIVQISDLDVIQELEDAISKIEKTTLHHYLEWHTIIYFGEFLDDRYREVMENFNFAVSGVTAVDKKADCLDTTTNIFSDVVSQMYIEKYHTRMEGQLEEMVDNVLKSFDEMLNENDWMDELTRGRAKEKLAAINKFLGYNKSIMNKTMLSKRYENLTFSDTDTYYDMVTKLQKWSQAILLLRLNTTRNNNEFEFPASQVNAFYDPTTNSIALTAAILQPPYYSEFRPVALNYGAIGTAIGHEITHGFDSIGSEFDKNGNRHKWWDGKTLEKFTKRTKCIVDQYSRFNVENTNQTGLSKLKKHRKEVVKGLEQFSETQLFFISNAYAWCGKSRPQQVLSQLYSDSHSPEKARINVVMGNQPEFSEAFQCPSGSPMNPIEKCSVW